MEEEPNHDRTDEEHEVDEADGGVDEKIKDKEDEWMHGWAVDTLLAC